MRNPLEAKSMPVVPGDALTVKQATLSRCCDQLCILGEQVPTGGWFSLMMAGIYAYIMLLWYYGSSRKSRYPPLVFQFPPPPPPRGGCCATPCLTVPPRSMPSNSLEYLTRAVGIESAPLFYCPSSL